MGKAELGMRGDAMRPNDVKTLLNHNRKLINTFILASREALEYYSMRQAIQHRIRVVAVVSQYCDLGQ